MKKIKPENFLHKILFKFKCSKDQPKREMYKLITRIPLK